MAVPYIFEYRTGNIPLSELDANFTYFTTSISVTGLNTSIGGSLTTGTNAVIGTTLNVGTNASIGGNLDVTGTTTFTGGVTIPSVSISGNATFTGTGNRIYGDFSNTTVANRVMFQSSTTNGSTVLGVIPNGTNTTAGVRLYSNSDPTNSSVLNTLVNSTEASVRSTINGTGTYLPLTFQTSGAEKMRLDTSGNLGIGNTPSGTYKLEVTGAGYYSGNVTIGGTLAVTGHTTFEGVTSTGATGTGNLVYATRPTMSVTCSAFTFQDPTDNTKQANFSIAGNTTATTRTYSLPTITDTLAGLGSVQTFSAAQTFNGGITAIGTLALTSSTTSNITLGTSQTTGTLTAGGTSQTGTMTLGQSTVSQTTNIQAGVVTTGNTKQINIGTGGLSGSTTNIVMGTGTAGATSATSIIGNLTFTPGNAGDIITVGGTTQTGVLTLGQSTATQTTNIQAGNHTAGQTKTINIGTNGLSGSTTNINIGSLVSGGATTFNGTITSTGPMLLAGSTTGNVALGTSTTTATIQIGGASSSGTFTLGQSTTSQTTNIQAGAVISGQTKTINIGTAGVSGSTTAIAIGSSVSGSTSTTTVNGILKQQVFTFATIPSAATVGAGGRSFISDSSITTFGTILAGGGEIGRAHV